MPVPSTVEIFERWQRPFPFMGGTKTDPLEWWSLHLEGGACANVPLAQVFFLWQGVSPSFHLPRWVVNDRHVRALVYACTD